MDLPKSGGLAALYMAGAYALGIAIFLFVLDYPNIADPAQRMALLIERPTLILVTNLILYVAFGIALIVLTAALYGRLKPASPALAQVAGATSLIWAGSLVASGMVANAGMQPAIELFAADPAQAAVAWAQTEAIASGLGNGNGEVLGGLMTLLFSVAGWRSGAFPRLLGLLGVAVGLVGIASTIPGLAGLAGVFGMGQILWFAGIAVVLLRGDGRDPRLGLARSA